MNIIASTVKEWAHFFANVFGSLRDQRLALHPNQRWSYVMGPMVALIVSLARAGWHPKFPPPWVDFAGITWHIISGSRETSDICLCGAHFHSCPH